MVTKKRMKSRSSFIHTTDKLIGSPSTLRIELWSNHLQSVPYKLMQTPSKSLASDTCGIWSEGKFLNRLRTKIGHSKHNMKKWKYIEDNHTTCECKEADQTKDHLLDCPPLQNICSLTNLIVYNHTAMACVPKMERTGVVTRQEDLVLRYYIKLYDINTFLFLD